MRQNPTNSAICVFRLPQRSKAAGLTFACLLALALAGCGIKGDLKRPGPIFDKNKSQTETPRVPPAEEPGASETVL